LSSDSTTALEEITDRWRLPGSSALIRIGGEAMGDVIAKSARCKSFVSAVSTEKRDCGGRNGKTGRAEGCDQATGDNFRKRELSVLVVRFGSDQLSSLVIRFRGPF
jgi:hypothetical protein